MIRNNHDRLGAKRVKGNSSSSKTEDRRGSGSGSEIDLDDDDMYPPPQTSRPLSSQQLSLLRSLSFNNTCVECHSLSKPDWASVTYGIVLCLDCAGIHRGLGVHQSFVRSLTMDDWTDDQYRRMAQGGNAKWKDYCEAHSDDVEPSMPKIVSDDSLSLSEKTEKDPSVYNREELTRIIRFKYESNAARAYREALSLTAKSCRVRADGTIAASSTPVPSPTLFEGVVKLEEEYPPSFGYIYTEQAWPFATSILGSFKSQLFLLAWGIMGISSAYGVHLWGMRKGGAGGPPIISSLPSSVNPIAHGQMGTTIMPTNPEIFSYYNVFALGILALSTGVPYLLLRLFASKVANALLHNRQDAFKSARNLLKDRISKGRALRMKRCDVYYPSISKNGEQRAKSGLIFYPGALVDRAAYAPIATRLSEMGILVAVANLEPARLVANLKNYPIKQEVMHILSDSVLLSGNGTWTVDEWAIGGHSLGGHVAIAAVSNELSSTVKKVVLWGVASYPDKNTYPCRQTLLELKDVNVLIVNGSEDKIAKSTKMSGPDKLIQFESKMPPPSSPSSFADLASRNSRGHTFHVTIDGGNHSGCAHYGPQTFPVHDGIRSITLEQQQRRTAEATADFLLGRSKRD